LTKTTSQGQDQHQDQALTKTKNSKSGLERAPSDTHRPTSMGLEVSIS